MMMRGYSGSRAAASPDGDTVLLDDSVFHNSHHDTSLHSIPEVGGHHSASIWNESAFHDEHGKTSSPPLLPLLLPSPPLPLLPSTTCILPLLPPLLASYSIPLISPHPPSLNPEP